MSVIRVTTGAVLGTAAAIGLYHGLKNEGTKPEVVMAATLVGGAAIAFIGTAFLHRPAAADVRIGQNLLSLGSGLVFGGFVAPTLTR